MSGTQSQQTQGAMDQKATYRPYAKPAFKYDPNNYMNSTLAMGNKRTAFKPSNFIGVLTPRPPSYLPEKTYKAGGVSGPYNFTGPVMRTQPVQPKFQ